MKPATPMPMTTSASSTLTAAMIPSSRFVVPSSPDMVCASERRRLVRCRIARVRPTRFANRVVQQLPALVRDAGRFLNGGAEAHELPCEVFERRLELPPNARPWSVKNRYPATPPMTAPTTVAAIARELFIGPSYHPCQNSYK